MKLPENVDEIAADFHRLPRERKEQILDHLRNTGGERAQATVAEIIRQGGVEGAFLTHIFGKDAPDRGASPENKKINPPNVKASVAPRQPNVRPDTREALAEGDTAKCRVCNGELVFGSGVWVHRHVYEGPEHDGVPM